MIYDVLVKIIVSLLRSSLWELVRSVSELRFSHWELLLIFNTEIVLLQFGGIIYLKSSFKIYATRLKGSVATSWVEVSGSIPAGGF